MPTVNKASFLVAVPILESALRMPDGHSILGAVWDFEANGLRVFAEGPSFQPVAEGCRIPQVDFWVAADSKPDA